MLEIVMNNSDQDVLYKNLKYLNIKDILIKQKKKKDALLHYMEKNQNA